MAFAWTAFNLPTLSSNRAMAATAGIRPPGTSRIVAAKWMVIG